MCQVTGQWSVREDLLVLYLDEEIPRYEPYRFYRIDGKVYTPIPMSQTNGKCIALRAQGDFIGKEVEFVD